MQEHKQDLVFNNPDFKYMLQKFKSSPYFLKNVLFILNVKCSSAIAIFVPKGTELR